MEMICTGMLAQLLTPDYAVFSGALVLMIGIGLIEALGLGLGHLDLGTDMDTDLDASSIHAPGVLDWLGLRSGLPVLIWLTSLLGCFTIAGVAVQQIAAVLFGSPLHWGIASIAALGLGGVANGAVSSGLTRILPAYESTVIDTDDLIMRRGTVLDGVARRGHPARAKVIDRHGQAHYVMVEPHLDSDSIGHGETALLVRRTGTLFFMQPDSSSDFRPL